MGKYEISRRRFVGTLVTIPSLVALENVSKAWPKPAGPRFTLCVFSKHLQWLDFKGVGEFAAKVGFDGVDLTVRPGG
ncbi:MAG TPA: sugar phosphate isomerase/epimerase, partial [Acidobacteriota bacterium]|nr:sugar phosphate isomerase/epimerase [Acidobacteriota bacterium]